MISLFPEKYLSSGLFCFPGKRFHWLELCQCVCGPAVLFLLSLQHLLGSSTLQVQKLGVSFQNRLAFRAVSKHQRDSRILLEIPISSCRLVNAEIEDSVNNN